MTAAMASYQRHLVLDRNVDRRAVTLKRIAEIHSLLGDHEQAVKNLEEANKLRPEDSGTILQLAEALLQVNADQQAIDRYNDFLKLVNGEVEKTVPEPHLVYNGIATAYHGMRKKYEAVDYYTLSLMFDRRQAVPLTKRAWAFLEDGVNLAIRDFETAKKLSPENPDTLIGLASAYAKNGQREDAIREVDTACPLARAQAVEVGPEAFALFHNAATVHGRLGASAILNPRLTTELRSQQFTESANRAVDLLHEAFEIAKSDAMVTRAMLTAMQTDEALRSIRGSKAYGKFIEELSKELSGGTSK